MTARLRCCGAAEVRIRQVHRVVGEVGRPVAALRRLGDVAQVGDADRRIAGAFGVVGLDRDRRFAEALIGQHRADLADGVHRRNLVGAAARHGDDEAAVAGVGRAEVVGEIQKLRALRRRQARSSRGPMRMRCVVGSCETRIGWRCELSINVQPATRVGSSWLAAGHRQGDDGSGEQLRSERAGAACARRPHRI